MVRRTYKDIPREKTEIITSNSFPESDTSNFEDPRYYPDMHKDRWIAKRGSRPDGTNDLTLDDRLEAAKRVIDALLTEEMVNKIGERIRSKISSIPPRDEYVIHVPFINTQSGRERKNVLGTAFTIELCNSLDAYCKKHLPGKKVKFVNEPMLINLAISSAYPDIQLDSGQKPIDTFDSGRSTASMIGRLVKLPLFEANNFKPGDMVILTDDHAQTAGTMLCRWNAVEDAGADVIAITTLSKAPETDNLQPHPELGKIIDEAIRYNISQFEGSANPVKYAQAHKKIETLFKKMGISYETMTNREAMIIIAHLTEPSKPEIREWFDAVCEKLKVDKHLKEGNGSSLESTFQEKAFSVDELCKKIDVAIPHFISIWKA